MSTTPFVEATSADPFVRDLYRKAVRMLNDPSLDRSRREFHMRQLQSILLEHQAKQATKAEKTAAKAAQCEQVSRADRSQEVADQSQVVARRKEFGAPAKEQEHVKATKEVGFMVEKTLQASQSVVAANDSQVPVRKRALLSLERA